MMRRLPASLLFVEKRYSLLLTYQRILHPRKREGRRPFSSSAKHRHAVALVTGGSSGLGAGAARALSDAGFRVFVADIEDTLLRKLSIPHAELLAMDVTDPVQVAAALDTVEERTGAAPNLVVNCAGIAMARKTVSIKEHFQHTRVHPLEDFTKTLQVNTVGTFLVSSLAAERMVRRPVDHSSYCIINTASIAAYEGQVGQVAYAASKGAIVGMTLPMARDLAPYKIRVMTIVSDDGMERKREHLYILYKTMMIWNVNPSDFWILLFLAAGSGTL